jgi:hypothetical protein
VDVDEDRRTRFRRVYMETLVKGFGKDLEKIREVCPSHLSFLDIADVIDGRYDWT